MDLNRQQILGNVGADPEIRYTPGEGKAVASFRIATNQVWKDRKTGEARKRTEWHRVVAFGPRAEHIEKYVTKGSRVYVEGPKQTRKYKDDDGKERYISEVIAQHIDVRPRGAGEASDGKAAAAGESTAPAEEGAAKEEPAPPGDQDDPFDDDDIPF